MKNFKGINPFKPVKHVFKTEFYKNGAIKAFHRPVKNFKNIYDWTYEGYDGHEMYKEKCVVYVNKNGQVYDISPRVSRNNDLFNHYYGRPFESLK